MENQQQSKVDADARQQMSMSKLSEILRRGLGHHRAGQLAQAEACYRQVLTLAPDHADALHLLGLIAHQVGRHDAAADLIRRAIAGHPQNARFYSDLGAVLKAQGQLDGALAALRQAIALKPDLADAHINLSALLRDAGKLDEALAACRQAIALRPDHAEAFTNLGVLLCDQGNFDEAVAAFRQAVRIDPQSAQAHFNLAHALHRQGNLEDAVAACRQAIRINPSHAEAQTSLGTLLCTQGELDDAIAAHRQAIRLRPGYADAYSNLGLALLAQGKLDEATAACDQAIRLAPDHAEAHSNLGMVFLAQGRFDDAIAAHHTAIRIRPDYADAYADLGRALHEANRTEEAIEAFRRATALKPDFVEAYNNLGLVLRAIGRLPEAKTALEEAVRLAPAIPKYHRNLSEIARFEEGDSRLAGLERLAADSASLRVEDQIELHFGLGKAYEDLGRHADAFRQWLEGNALKRRQIVYDEEATLTPLTQMEAAFTPEVIQSRQKSGPSSALPIFIVGMPRSGTTLVEQILASHPQVFGGGELPYFAAAANGLRASRPEATTIAQFVAGVTDEDLRNLGARYLADLSRLAPDAARITDKMPSNFLFAGLIHLALPNATIIHTVRDPIDTCLSCFSKLFIAELNYSCDLVELGRYYRHYRALMAHWHNVMPAGGILDVRYEDVVADLEAQARRIVAHCGLEWDPRCLAFYQTERPVRTASATQVRQPIYDRSIGRWRKHEAFLGPLLEEIGRPHERASLADD
jgi:tetratricopeptide (TPR) repeat protein